MVAAGRKGYFNYHAVPTNSSTQTAFLFHVTNFWRRTLPAAEQKDWTTWERIKRLADDWLPKCESFIRGQRVASPLDTQGGRSYGADGGGHGTFIVHTN